MRALKISCDIITKETLRGRLFDEPSLNSMLAVEKERLAREIIYPLLNIISRSILPILAILEITKLPTNIILSFVLPISIVITIYTICASLFRRFAKELQSGIQGIAIVNSAFSNLYQSSFNSFSSLGMNEALRDRNKTISIAEAKIDVVSQAPRASLDLLVMIIIVLSYIYTNDSLSDLQNLILASPILVRSASSVQFVYKSVASIISNKKVITLLNLKNEMGQKNEADRRIIDLDDLRKDGYKVVGMQFPSGYGKTNAILNLIYPDLNAKTELKFESQIDNAMIQYISAKPYFLVDAFPEIAKKSVELFPDHTEMQFLSTVEVEKCSQGERFRANFLQCFLGKLNLLIIDEAFSYIDNEKRLIILNYLRGRKDIMVIIVTHNSDILNLCDYVVTSENYA